MKNWKCLSLVALAFALALPVSAGNGRQVGTPTNPDAWSVFGGSCAGGSGVTGCEIAIDYTGNLLPTVTNVQTLGTSALIFSNVYTNAVTNSGLDTNAGIRTTALTASTTGLAVVAAAAQTADLVDLSSASATTPTIRVGPGGQLRLKLLTKAQFDTEVPITAGAIALCSNCTLPYQVCIGTGTSAAQWGVLFSSANYKGTGQVLRPGCGTNE